MRCNFKCLWNATVAAVTPPHKRIPWDLRDSTNQVFMYVYMIQITRQKCILHVFTTSVPRGTLMHSGT